MKKIILASLLLLPACNWTGPDTSVCAPKCTVEVTAVHSGSHFTIETGQVLRLSLHNSRPPHTVKGKAQRDCLSSLILGKDVTLYVTGHAPGGMYWTTVQSHAVSCKETRT